MARGEHRHYLQHGVAVAGVAEIFETIVMLRIGEGGTERLLETLALAPGRTHAHARVLHKNEGAQTQSTYVYFRQFSTNDVII